MDGGTGISKRGANTALALLLAINLFNYIDRYVLAACEPEIGRTLFRENAGSSSSLSQTGSLASAFFLSYMLAAPIFGWLADRMSRWILVGASVLLWSLASGASGLAGTFTLLLITRLFVGIGEAGYGPAAPTIIADLYPLERRGRALAWFYLAIPVGSAIGYAIGGWIASRWGWRWAFYAVVPPGLLLGVASFFMKETRRVGGGDRRGRPRLAQYVGLLTIRSYVLDTLGMAALTFAIGGISFWMPHYLREVRGLPASSGVTFGGILCVAGFLATMSGGFAGDWLKKYFRGSYFLVSGLGILTACPFILLMLWTPFPLAWVWIFGAVFFLFFNTGPSNTILANVTHPSIRATAFAVNILVIHVIGDVLSPPLLGKIAGHAGWGWDWAFGLVVVVMVVAGLLWLWGVIYLADDTERVAAATEGRASDLMLSRLNA